MSPATESTLADDEFARVAIPLLKEYAEKLAELATQALEFLNSAQKVPAGGGLSEYARGLRYSYQQRLKYLLPPAKELARQVSAVVEQGHTKSLDRVELWLRLAELESALESANAAVQVVNAKK